MKKQFNTLCYNVQKISDHFNQNIIDDKGKFTNLENKETICSLRASESSWLDGPASDINRCWTLTKYMANAPLAWHLLKKQDNKSKQNYKTVN